jgi:hypothetical protein
MSKQPARQTDATTKYDATRLVVRGVRRTEADWDLYVAILLSHALRKVGAADLPDRGEKDG